MGQKAHQGSSLQRGLMHYKTQQKRGAEGKDSHCHRKAEKKNCTIAQRETRRPSQDDKNFGSFQTVKVQRVDEAVAYGSNLLKAGEKN